MVDITATIESPEEISVTVEGGITNFIGLTDVDPTTYSGQSGKTVTVNSGEDGLEFTSSGSGDVVGPGVAVDENITVFDSTTGKLIKDSTVNISEVTANTAKTGITSQQTSDITTNNAKNTNVSTDLSEGTSTETTVDVDSSDGTNATLVSASTIRAGLLTKAKFDEIVVNNAKTSYTDAAAVSSNTTHRSSDGSDHSDVVTNSSKVTNATHTGDVTGSTSLTIGADKIKDTMIDFGTGAGQVSTDDLPEGSAKFVTSSDITNLGNLSGTNTGDQTIPTVDDTAYNSTSWDANSDAATKNAIRDKFVSNDSSISSNTTHRGSSGTDHSDVVTNTTHRGLTNNPHSVDSGDVGLSNVSDVATDDTAYNATSWNTNSDSATKNAIRDKIETMDTAIGLNTSKVTNVSTDLSAGTRTATTIKVDSSDGTDATLVEADTTNAGILGSDKWDEIVANTLAKHPESHDIASHSDTTATGTELNTLTGGGDTTLHDHDGISENTTHRSSDGSDHSIVGSNTTAIGLNTTHRGSAGGGDHSDVNTNNAKVSFTKTNVKGTINHGSTAGTARPSGFDSVEWIGDVEPSNSINTDTWIDST